MSKTKHHEIQAATQLQVNMCHMCCDKRCWEKQTAITQVKNSKLGETIFDLLVRGDVRCRRTSKRTSSSSSSIRCSATYQVSTAAPSTSDSPVHTCRTLRAADPYSPMSMVSCTQHPTKTFFPDHTPEGHFPKILCVPGDSGPRL